MARLKDLPDGTYEALAQMRDTALASFDSLFTPDRQLWTRANLEVFHHHFVGGLDDGDGTFLEKYRGQLSDAGDDIIQLAAELLYAQQFFTTRTGLDKKQQNVEEVLSWCERAVKMPAWARAGLEQGLAGDQSFNQHRPFHIAWLTEFLLHWHGLDADNRQRLLADPWKFRRAVHSVEFSGGAYQPMREAWLYMIFPDSFENISSRKDKRLIRETFRDELRRDPSDNIDADLLEIRHRLELEHGQGFHFYRTPVRERWKQGKKKSRAKLSPALGGRGSPASEPKGPGYEPTRFEDLADELFLEPAEVVHDWVEQLRDAGQLIFQGPPGTGKTYIARQLARMLAKSSDGVELVQFHPSYAYEDFVEGYRPSGASQFALCDGPLKRIAARAKAAPEREFVLLIDEINRGNLSKIFGELYFLLEYRDEEIALQYSKQPFSLPRNVLLLGTMNTADRSIALLDMALRRRFRFVELVPDRPPIQGLLRRYLEDKAPDLIFLADMLDNVNARLDDAHAAIGPSHFLRKDIGSLTEAKAERIWEHAIIPALAERFFDTPYELENYRYSRVRSAAWTSEDDAAVADAEEGEEADEVAAPAEAG